ncbi:electron transport complex subunit RsxC [bacterium]|nr:electron transport complex subunit RsxC [bacterium]
MEKFTFKAGVHLPACKKLTIGEEIKETSIPQQVVIPLSQHIGCPAQSIVSKGEKVKVGQKIGEAQGNVSVPVHSSISGEVVDICPQLHPVSGKKALSVIIKSDGRDEWIEKGKRHEDYFRLSSKEICNIIKEAGIAGLGGAAFPTHIKLSPPKEVDTVILNGVECEPYLSGDEQLMIKHPLEIIEGLKIIMQTVKASWGIVGIEDNKPRAIDLMKKEIAKQPNISLKILKEKYPQGGEKQLIKALLNREVPSGGLPMDVGVLVDNVGTSFAIREAVIRGFPLVSRVVTVTGWGVFSPKNLRVRIGSSISFLIEECGGFSFVPGKVIMGGPMMGITQYNLEVPVVKGTSGILVFGQQEAEKENIRDCIRCSKCIDACPMGLLPCMIALYAQNQDWEKAKEYNLLDCMECGACTYVCPAKRPIVQYVKWAKDKLKC